MIILKGNIIAEKKLEILKKEILNLQTKPKMSIIQVGDIFESNKYIDIKIKKANMIGITTNHIKLDDKISEIQIIEIIKNELDNTDGLIVQLPLPSNLRKKIILDSVDFSKDIDGLSSKNQELLYAGKKCIFPATAKAIVSMLLYYKIEFKNKQIVIVGESNLVGKPTRELLIRMGAEVKNLNKNTGIKGTENADILIVAAGSPNLIKSENVKKNAIIIDVGVSRDVDSNKMSGDVDFESVKNKAFGISPMIGGIGPLTVVSLLENLLEVCKTKSSENK